MRRLVVILTLLIFYLSMGGRAWGQAQITTGSIQGTVVDEKGGAVADSTVQATNLDTNLSATVMTDTDGRFQFLSLAPGRYTVTISKSGFATMDQTGVTLTVGQTLSLPVTMKVSATQEKIEVTATPDIVDTVSSTSTDTLDEQAVAETPLLGRKFEDLLTLTPGVSIVQGPDGDEINFNGQRGVFNNISLDGGDFNNGFFGEQLGGQRAAIDITLDAVKEFQVVASGANAEFGRTAGGVVNVITKSGTNEVHGSAFYYQRLEALTSHTSDGMPLQDFKREQFGGTVGGPIVKDMLFFFGSGEGILEDLTRNNLSVPIGSTPCAVSNPVFNSNITDAQISANADCQRLVLLNFMKTNFNENDGLPVSHQIRNGAGFGRGDYNLNSSNQISASYNFDWSKNLNQTFDVPTYGTTANGIEGPAKVQTFNANWFTTVSPTKLNEAHFTYSRENRPRLDSDTAAVPDTGIGFVPSFRFGQPFFFEPKVDEVFWRTEIRDNFSIIHGAHTIKFGGDFLHSANTQIFRGFFGGRYLFDSAVGFLHYASPASLGPGFGPSTEECASGAFTDASLLTRPMIGGQATATCPDASLATEGPLLFYLQHGPTTSGESLDASGASSIANNEYALFLQDTWKVTRNFTLNYGLRWEAQIFPDPTLAPAKTAYGSNLSDPKFPSTGFLPNQKKMFQPRVGFAWDIRGNGKSALRASWGIFNARQNMLTQVGALTTNGVQQQSIFASSCVDAPACDFFNTATGGAPPTYPNTVPIPLLAPGTFPFQPGVTVFSKDYANPRIYSVNVAYEQQIGSSLSAYAQFDWSMGVHLTRFEDPNSAKSGFAIPANLNSDTVDYTGNMPFPNLGSITNTTSDARSLYRGVTVGVKEHLGQKFQMEANYTYSKDMDDDSNERDPFTFRYANFYNLKAEYAYSDRDERHRFNFYTYAKLPWGFNGDVRMQAHSAQPITDNSAGDGSGAPCTISNSRTRFVNGVDCGRNHLRKDNAYFTFDLALDRTFHLGERMSLIPKMEIFNLFNNANNINTLTSPALFNFDGFLREGVGDPRQAQLSVRFQF
ncbi:MAG TPA: carboxypeptidase regulatory-like domain-containing protein [Candidatus Acidoferrales bacterium]|nr:carboxypeptidase regulatory-like domain-containing protein [Candidatus Acidoferrales bacterium]